MKEKYLATNKAVARRDGEHLCKSMVKAGIPPYITEETIRRVL